MKLRSITTLVVGWALTMSCKGHEQEHGHGGAEHDDHGAEHAHGGHGDGDLPAESLTLWTDKAELFMEWDPLIVGQESRFLAHITDMSNDLAFKAVAAGKVVVTVTVGDTPIQAEVEKPARLGIFIPAISPSTAGPCTMTILLESSDLRETFTAPDCIVYPDRASAAAVAQEDEAANQIGFLKEQQWPIDFATVASVKQQVTPSITVNAKVHAVPGREARLTAGTMGRVSLQDDVPSLGGEVAKGQILARIQPVLSAPGNIGTLRADIAAARAEHAASQAALARLERLVASDSVPKRRLDEASAASAVTQAQLSAAKTRLSSYQASASGKGAQRGAFLVKSPIRGTLVERSVTHGETVAAGAQLFTVIDLDRVRVEGRVFEPDLPTFENSTTAWFTVAGRKAVFEIAEGTGELVTLGHVLDPKSRTVPVIFEVDNPKRMLRIGQFAKLSVGTGAAVEALVIPEAALIADGNQRIAFVHASGESFERRVLTLGSRSRGVVVVRQGLSEGERVVTVGAYDIKLSSAGGAPAHGHAH